MIYFKIALLIIPLQITLLIYATGVTDILPSGLNWLTLLIQTAALLLLGPFALMLSFGNIVFANSAVFFTTSIMGILAAAFVLFAVRHLRTIAIFSLTSIALLLFAPFLLPTLYGDYTIYASSRDGYELRWTTKPESRFQSAFKSAQRRHDLTGCRYSLIGWDANNHLYYESSCHLASWQYSPARDRPSKVGSSQPSEQMVTEVKRSKSGISLSSPVGVSNRYTYPFKTLETSISADGKWTAAVIANYYGPMDVIVVSSVSNQ